MSYGIPALGFGFLGAFIALSLFGYGITCGLEYFDEWRNKSK
jgi:hypothetical protein